MIDCFDHTLYGNYLINKLFDIFCVQCYVFYAPIGTGYDHVQNNVQVNGVIYLCRLMILSRLANRHIE